jgi:hypothetical protein
MQMRPAGVSGKRLNDAASLTFITAGETLRPLRDQLIVRVIPPKWSTGLAIEYRGEALRGEIIAAGPGLHPNVHRRGKKDGKDYHTVRRSGVFRPTEVKPGDIVELGGAEIGGYLWQRVNYRGAECIICREQDVAGVHHASP